MVQPFKLTIVLWVAIPPIVKEVHIGIWIAVYTRFHLDHITVANIAFLMTGLFDGLRRSDSRLFNSKRFVTSD